MLVNDEAFFTFGLVTKRVLLVLPSLLIDFDINEGML